MTDIPYGPPNPPLEVGYTSSAPNRSPLRGQANKIIYDLNRLLRLYSGIEARVFSFNSKGTTRCSVCTDAFTGESILSDCPTCFGTGVVPGYLQVGDFWIGVNFTPNANVATEYGNTINPGANEDYLCIVGMPNELKDRDVIILKHSKEAYKIVDREPEIVGLGGIIIMQIISAPVMEKGNPLYRLINW